MCELVQTMTAPLVCMKHLRTYAEQQSDLARRKRNRVLACVALAVIAGIVIVQLFGR